MLDCVIWKDAFVSDLPYLEFNSVALYVRHLEYEIVMTQGVRLNTHELVKSCNNSHCTNPLHTVSTTINSNPTLNLNDCVLWKNALSVQPKFAHLPVRSYNNGYLRMDKVSYELFNGCAVKTAANIEHTCGRTMCINPNHLRLKTTATPTVRSNFEVDLLKPCIEWQGVFDAYGRPAVETETGKLFICGMLIELELNKHLSLHEIENARRECSNSKCCNPYHYDHTVEKANRRSRLKDIPATLVAVLTKSLEKLDAKTVSLRFGLPYAAILALKEKIAREAKLESMSTSELNKYRRQKAQASKNRYSAKTAIPEGNRITRIDKESIALMQNVINFDDIQDGGNMLQWIEETVQNPLSVGILPPEDVFEELSSLLSLSHGENQ